MAGCLVSHNNAVVAYVPGLLGKPSPSGQAFLDQLKSYGILEPERLFWISEADGHMYLDRNYDEPFRKNVAYWTSEIKSVADLKGLIRAADRAFGARRLVLWMNDSECLCHRCARTEFRQIAEAVRDKDNNGWRAIAASTDEEVSDEDYVFCAHCNKTI